MDKNLYVVNSDDNGVRLDVYVTSQTNLTRSRIKNLIESGNITVNGCVVKCGYSLRDKDEVLVVEPDIVVCNAEPENIPIDIIYEDDDIIVVNKAQGMVTHPAVGNENGTLVNALMYHTHFLSDINGVIRPGIVHRLDKMTSGLIVIAKTNDAHLSLARQIATKQCRRIYRAVVDGNIKENDGIINAPIARSKRDRKKMAVDNDGREAITLFHVLERYGNFTLVEYELKTGRTHQIRVHSAYIKHPVIGDEIYGGSNKFGLKGQLLHATKLILTHPTKDEVMMFDAPYPTYFIDTLSKLRQSLIEVVER